MHDIVDTENTTETEDNTDTEDKPEFINFASSSNSCQLHASHACGSHEHTTHTNLLCPDPLSKHVGSVRCIHNFALLEVLMHSYSTYPV